MIQTVAGAALQAARHLAARGDYAGAAALLDTLGAEADGVAVRLLRAKMFAQQDRLDEALIQWREVLSMAPTNQEAERGVSLAAQLQGRRGRHFYLRANLYYSLLLLAVVGLSLALAFHMGRSAGRAETPSAPMPPSDDSDRQLTMHRELLDALRQANGAEDRILGAVKDLRPILQSLHQSIADARAEQRAASQDRQAEVKKLEDGLAKLPTLLNEREEKAQKLVGEMRQIVESLRGDNLNQYARLTERLNAIDMALKQLKGK